MERARLLIATHNRGKLAEFQAIFHDMPLELLTLDEVGILHDIEETGTTFAENARLKALGYAELSGVLTLADDSGLEVDALAGAPGIYSARYAASPAEYRSRVLHELEGIPDERRSARFRCVICIAEPDRLNPSLIGEVDGSVEGRIAHSEAGTYGFGYDPIFYLPAYDCTMAQLDPVIKNRISHRAIAARRALEVLKTYLEESH